MTEDDQSRAQIEAASVIAERYRKALAALARDPSDTSASFKAQMDLARERMKKYEAVCRRLAK
jgi:hypothetical protein